jgi:hypothetical protein
VQGCQILLGATYQNGENICTKLPQIYQIATKYIHQMAVKNKGPLNIPTSSIARPFRIYPNLEFRFEKIPSGNPGLE